MLSLVLRLFTLVLPTRLIQLNFQPTKRAAAHRVAYRVRYRSSLPRTRIYAQVNNWLLLCLLVVTMQFAAPHNAFSQSKPDDPPPYSIKENYTKYEYRIPMRDGKKLFTTVYAPKESAKPAPFLMVRTPYSVAPYGVDQYRDSLGPSTEFDRAGYIFVFQDVRGRYMSEGAFIDMTPHKAKKSGSDVDESTDMFDSAEWLLKNIPNNNGRIGLWGISYPGFYVSASIIDSHPAIKAASPQAPVTDM
jgi:predicted acyl esterase